MESNVSSVMSKLTWTGLVCQRGTSYPLKGAFNTEIWHIYCAEKWSWYSKFCRVCPIQGLWMAISKSLVLNSKLKYLRWELNNQSWDPNYRSWRDQSRIWLDTTRGCRTARSKYCWSGKGFQSHFRQHGSNGTYLESSTYSEALSVSFKIWLARITNLNMTRC